MRSKLRSRQRISERSKAFGMASKAIKHLVKNDATLVLHALNICYGRKVKGK
jgi:hypothetical protein